MGHLKKITAILVLLTMSACTNVQDDTFGIVSSDRIDSAIRIVRHDVIVPRELTVSEANLYWPNADIVWRDDPPGNRHEQVQTLVEESMDWGLSAFDRGKNAVVTIEIEKFHALSQKARYTVGGVHTMRLNMLVWDASTGQSIYGPVAINADLNALGGSAAIAAEAEGRTQKARIRQHLAGTIQRALLGAGLGQTKGNDISG